MLLLLLLWAIAQEQLWCLQHTHDHADIEIGTRTLSPRQVGAAAFLLFFCSVLPLFLLVWLGLGAPKSTHNQQATINSSCCGWVGFGGGWLGGAVCGMVDDTRRLSLGQAVTLPLFGRWHHKKTKRKPCRACKQSYAVLGRDARTPKKGKGRKAAEKGRSMLFQAGHRKVHNLSFLCYN